MYHNLFVKEKIPDDDILLPYKLFLQIVNNQEICPVIEKSNSEIWFYFCDILEKNAEGKPGSYLSSLLATGIDDSSKNMNKILTLLGPNGYKITPNYYSKLCGTTGLLVFFIKDVLEYFGIIIDRKSNAKRVLKTFSDLITYLTELKSRGITSIDKL